MWKFHQYLYNKQNITWLLGDTNFIFSILSALEDKIRIPERSCNILYVCDLCDATQRDAFFNVLLNTKIRQSASIFMKPMVEAIF